MSLKLLVLGAVGLFGAVSAVGQTVTYMPPVLESAPDTTSVTAPPLVRWHWRPEYPDQLKHSQEIGYALVHVVVGSDGKLLSVDNEVNAAPLGDSLNLAHGDLWTIKPARLNDKPIDTRAYFAAIFNPPPAPGPGYDVPAQLVVVHPIQVVVKGARDGERIVRATLLIGRDGRVADAVADPGEDPVFRKAIKEGLNGWAFTPALLGRKPVESHVNMAIVLTVKDEVLPAKKEVRIPPRVLHQQRPVYPPAMRYLGIQGTVVVDFVVNPKGRVINAYPISSTAPWFDGAALDAVRQWTFKPATVDGVPCNVHLEVPIVFQLNDGFAGGQAYGVTGSLAKGEFPAQVQNVIPPVFPYAMLARHQGGSASVSMLVAPDGHVARVKVDQASSPEFGLALSAAAFGYTFQPAFKDGKPVFCVIHYKQPFVENEMVGYDTESALELKAKHPERILFASDLDRMPAPISRRPPVVPPALEKDETVMVSFLIDEKGGTQLAHVENPVGDICEYVAVQAVSSWLFEPPLSHGKVVVTHATVPFEFHVSRDPAPELTGGSH